MTVTQKRVAWFAGTAVGLNVLMLFSGYRVLVKEERGIEESPFSMRLESTKLGDTLECTYWTGRSVRTYRAGAYDWKPDECPFFLKPKYLS